MFVRGLSHLLPELIARVKVFYMLLEFTVHIRFYVNASTWPDTNPGRHNPCDKLGQA